MQNWQKGALFGVAGLAALYWNTPDRKPSNPSVTGIEQCASLAEIAGAAMGFRQLGGDEAEMIKTDMSGAARRIVLRAYREPLVTSDEKALVVRNFSDAIKHECLENL